MFGRIIYGDLNLYVGGNQLSGVNSFRSDFQVPYENVDTIGYLDTNQGITKGLTRNMSFDRYLVGNDPILPLTGNSGVGGSIIYKNPANSVYNNYGFNSGYLTSYKLSAAIGQFTKVNTDFEIFGGVGGGISGSESVITTAAPFVPSQLSMIYLNASEGSSDRIVGFDYAIHCKRMPQYVLGSLNPKYIVPKKPLHITVSFTVEIETYMTKDIQTLVNNPFQQNLGVYLNNCDGSTTSQPYSVTNATLIANSFNSNLSSNADVKLTYQGYVI